MTPLDTAFAAMAANPDDTAARLAWFDRLAASELVLLLEEEAQGDRVKPRIFTVEGADLVLAFDRDERLAEFAGSGAPYAAMSGRALAGMLTDAGLGLGVNLGAPSETVLENEAMAWLSGVLSEQPAEVEDQPEEVRPPANLPEALLTALDLRLASAIGRANMAYLVATTFAGGRQSHLLAFIDPAPGAETALAQLVAEALTFSGLEAASLDVGFFRASDPFCAQLAKVGLRFDLPQPEEPPKRTAPGTDPEQPPKLR
ncbi:SseB family protein [Gymnodinialimonas hymeniacidonis]|uniref:SseB family protein n=1 Tax=Gymnodinialimonas hymeniacidonis TaxID=3126508 RepID=UPI0034C64D84